MFRVPALGDQVKYQVYCADLSAENRGLSWEMFSIDVGCAGCRIVLFRSICEDMNIVGIFFFDFFFLIFLWILLGERFFCCIYKDSSLLGGV